MPARRPQKQGSSLLLAVSLDALELQRAAVLVRREGDAA